MSLAPDDYSPTTRERLGLFRRLNRREQPATDVYSLTAAGTNIEIGNDAAIQAILRNREQWQTQVFDALVCGELRNAVYTVGALMSKVTLFAAEMPKEKDAEPVPTSDEKVNATMSRLGTHDEVATILHDTSVQKLLPGEWYLVGISPTGRPFLTKEEWHIRSIHDLQPNSGKASFVHPSGNKIELQSGKDTWIRMWTPSARNYNKADSPTRPLLEAIDELTRWDAAARAVALNRAALAGFIGVPTNLEVPAEAGDDPRLSGVQRFVKRLFSNIVKAIKDPFSPSAAAPFVYTYPWNETGKSGLDVTVLERPQDELLEKRTDRALRRIAQGFPLPVEMFFGIGEATYGGAGTIERSKYVEHVDPFVRSVVNDFTKFWFRPILRKSGIDADKYLVWYDESSLVVIRNVEEQSNKGVELGGINLKAWRRDNNYSEADAPNEKEREEQLSWIRALRGREGNPAVQEDAEPAKEPGQEDVANPVEPDSGSSHPPRSKPAAPARRKGQPIFASADNATNNPRQLGRRLAEIDADLLSRLQVMASEQMRQARIKAGNYISNRAKKNPALRASIRNVDPEDVAVTLGREHVMSLGTEGMLDGTFEEVPRLFSDWCDKAVGAAIEAAELPSTIVASSTFQLAYSTEDAATSLVRELKELAAKLVFESPDPSSIEPESDDLLVPASVIRRALAKVGNPNANGSTNLLLATGRSFTRHLSEAGHFATEHEWWYPPTPRKTFSHHRKLDGTRFKVDDSPHQPGDGTAHCRCLAVPVFEP